MNRFVLSLGSNSSDRYEKMDMTIERLNSLLNIEVASSVYETLPWGGGDKLCINCVMAGTTAMDKESLKKNYRQAPVSKVPQDGPTNLAKVRGNAGAN